jgi:hypothetical protein
VNNIYLLRHIYIYIYYIILFTIVLQLHLITRIELLVVINAETFDSVRIYVCLVQSSGLLLMRLMESVYYYRGRMNSVC